LKDLPTLLSRSKISPGNSRLSSENHRVEPEHGKRQHTNRFPRRGGAVIPWRRARVVGDSRAHAETTKNTSPRKKGLPEPPRLG
jgi:hypothetical protein